MSPETYTKTYSNVFTKNSVFMRVSRLLKNNVYVWVLKRICLKPSIYAGFRVLYLLYTFFLNPFIGTFYVLL